MTAPPSFSHSAAPADSAFPRPAAMSRDAAGSGTGGVGWFIFENKNQLLIPNVFAGLLTVIVFGLFVEHVIFRTIEEQTVRKWGMQS